MMNKLFKIFMVIAVCAALLVMVGCNKQDDTTGGAGSNQSTGSSDASEGTGGAEQQDTQNPEGDPHDGTLPTGQSKATEPPVGIEDPTEDTQEDDFNVDFGDLTA